MKSFLVPYVAVLSISAALGGVWLRAWRDDGFGGYLYVVISLGVQTALPLVLWMATYWIWTSRWARNNGLLRGLPIAILTGLVACGFFVLLASLNHDSAGRDLEQRFFPFAPWAATAAVLLTVTRRVTQR